MDQFFEQAKIFLTNLFKMVVGWISMAIEFVKANPVPFIISGAVFLLIVIIVVFFSIKGANKRRKKEREDASRRQRTLPTASALLGFNPDEKAVVLDTKGNFYAIASSVASIESALDLKNDQHEIIMRKIKEITAEKVSLEERIKDIERVQQALKSELDREIARGRKKLKSRVVDMQSEIANNNDEIEMLRIDIQFCEQKIEMCMDAQVKVREEIALLQVNATYKKEEMKSAENKNGATYEEVKNYERGVCVMDKYPTIVAPLKAYIDAYVKVDDSKKTIKEINGQNDVLRQELKQLYAVVSTSNDTPLISRQISSKNRELDENNAKISQQEITLSGYERDMNSNKNALMVTASQLAITTEDLTFAEATMLAQRRYEYAGKKMQERLAQNMETIARLNKEYNEESKVFDKCGKRELEKREACGKRLAIIGSKMSKVKEEIETIESFIKDYPTMTPAAFYKKDEMSMLKEGRLPRDGYMAELARIKREYVEIVRGSLDFGSKEDAERRKAELLQRLEVIEKQIYAEKTALRTKALTKQYRNEYGVVNQRKVRIISELEKYKEELKNIDTKYAADEYRAKLRRFIETLSPDELADKGISTAISYCMDISKLLGEQAQALWEKGLR